MSTVGTLYDETIKNGFAKLLSAQTVTNVSAVDFVAPLVLALGYRTFWFDFDNVLCNAEGDRMVAYVSGDSGASFVGDYLWSFSRMYSHAAGDFYGSVALNPSAGGAPYRDSMWIGDTTAANYYTSGRLYFHRLASGMGGATRMLYGEMVTRPAGNGLTLITHAQVPWTGVDFNAIRFRYTSGTMSGAIRLYGLNTGN